MKASNILVDHRIKLECKRAQHRKEFEANFRSQSAIDNIPSTSRPTPAPSRPVVQTQAPPQIISGLPVLIPTPDCPEPTSVPSMPPMDMFDNQMEVPVKPVKQTPFPPNCMNNENKLKYDITECLKNDQYFKLIQMMNRHTFKRKVTFIEQFGGVLRYGF